MIAIEKPTERLKNAQAVVQQLSADERKQLREWLDEWEEQAMDRWLEEAVLGGKFDALIEKAREDSRNGKFVEVTP